MLKPGPTHIALSNRQTLLPGRRAGTASTICRSMNTNIGVHCWGQVTDHRGFLNSFYKISQTGAWFNKQRNDRSTFLPPQYQLNPTVAGMTTITSAGITTNFSFKQLCPKVKSLINSYVFYPVTSLRKMYLPITPD